MAHALNFTIPIKQDPETLERLSKIASVFATDIQPRLDAALRKSQFVHFARLFVIDNRYIVVITEYDGDHMDYTEVFRKELPDVFELLFSLSEKSPPPGIMEDWWAFWEYSKSLQVRSLGDSTTGDHDMEGKPAGYLFSAYWNSKVKDILAKLSPEDNNAG